MINKMAANVMRTVDTAVFVIVFVFDFIVYYIVLLVSIIHEYGRLVKPFFPCEKISGYFSIGKF